MRQQNRHSDLIVDILYIKNKKDLLNLNCNVTKEFYAKHDNTQITLDYVNIK